MSNVIAPSRRRLSDLYIRGVELALNDDEGDDPIVVWVSKLTPLQREQAGAEANKERAKALLLKNAPDMDAERIARVDQLELVGLDSRESRINFIVMPELQRLEKSISEEIAGRDEWSKDNYLVSLQDSWNDSLHSKYDEDPEDVDAKRVFAELMRYTEAVNKKVSAGRRGLVKEYESASEAEVLKKALDRAIEVEADTRWYHEFKRWIVYFAVRLPESHKDLYFESKVEVDELDQRIFDRIFDTYESISVDPVEGKG
jgi:hypothetical protein